LICKKKVNLNNHFPLLSNDRTYLIKKFKKTGKDYHHGK